MLLVSCAHVLLLLLLQIVQHENTCASAAVGLTGSCIAASPAQLLLGRSWQLGICIHPVHRHPIQYDLHTGGHGIKEGQWDTSATESMPVLPLTAAVQHAKVAVVMVQRFDCRCGRCWFKQVDAGCMWVGFQAMAQAEAAAQGARRGKGLTASGAFGFRDNHCSPVSSRTADRRMPNTSARDWLLLASTTGAICNFNNGSGKGCELLAARACWFLKTSRRYVPRTESCLLGCQ